MRAPEFGFWKVGVPLADYFSGRDNNFNLIRFALATMVLVHHGFVLTDEPIQSSGIASRFASNMGEIAVNGFFTLSGFLVTGSLLGRSTITRFFLSRAVRIYPGLWVMLLATSVALWALFGPSLSKPDLTTYLAGNATAFLIIFQVEGAFNSLPVPVVNGSLWSLKFELACYLGLGIAGLFGVARRRWMIVVGVIACGCVLIALPQNDAFSIMQWSRLGLYFGLGALAAAYAMHIRMHSVWALTFIAIALVLDGSAAAEISWAVAFAYSLLWFAYIPRGQIRIFNTLPDISYGLYIYAYPVQQIVILLGIGAAPSTNIAAALPITVCLATLSWYGIEKPALSLKRIGVRNRP